MPRSLQSLGIEIADGVGYWYRCLECLATWSPNLLTGGRRPRGWWHCPGGCNADR